MLTCRSAERCPSHGTCSPSGPTQPRPPTRTQPVRLLSWLRGFRRRARGAEARLSLAYPVLSLQSLLNAALGIALAPGWGRAAQGRGWPVLLGQLGSLLLPWGVLKQTLHAVHGQLAACLSALLGSEERSPRPPVFPRLPGPLWQMEAASGSARLASATAQTVPVGLRPVRPRRTPLDDLGPPAAAATFLPTAPPLPAAQPAPHPDGPSPGPPGLPPWVPSWLELCACTQRLLRTQEAPAPKAHPTTAQNQGQ